MTFSACLHNGGDRGLQHQRRAVAQLVQRRRQAIGEHRQRRRLHERIRRRIAFPGLPLLRNIEDQYGICHCRLVACLSMTAEAAAHP